MKIAVLADIHGNLPALEAVIADMARESPDMVVNLGDCVSGPLWPDETGHLLMDKAWMTVGGNHDRVAVGPPVHPNNQTDHFTQSVLSSTVIDWLAALPFTCHLDESAAIFHATPHQDDLYLTESVTGENASLSSPAEILGRLGDGATSKLFLCGHTHIPRLIALPNGQTIFNPGSVGCPAYSDETPNHHVMEAGSPHARYGLLEKTGQLWTYRHKAIEYDWAAASKQAQNNGREGWAHALSTGFYPR
ncbi:metallophosphoesterase family protein [Labrenzia sp. CE80]|uniref:metallophosphoesterase family protein n=1 Tax=Labrenzia sp. CE80 TaxID=1788986 RepID=UPI00129AADC9|nr:metallophosphoesterase family protein [Labrenzia sp. CE80]